MTPADYEVSGAYVDALVRALKREALPDVLAAMPEASRPMIQDPWSEAWHPAVHLEAFGAAVVTVHGAAAFEELAYRAMIDRFSSIIMPMLKRSLETTGRSPSAILSRLTGLVELGMRGLEITWKEKERGGILQIKYPRAVEPQVEHSWRGVLRFVFEQTQASGQVAEFLHLPNRTTLQYRLSW